MNLSVIANSQHLKLNWKKNKPWDLFQDFKFILDSILQSPSVYKHVSFEVQLTYFS